MKNNIENKVNTDKVNTEIRNFSQNIVDIINGSKLPVELKRLSLYMIYTEVQRMADQTIDMETNTTYETSTSSNIQPESESTKS